MRRPRRAARRLLSAVGARGRSRRRGARACARGCRRFAPARAGTRDARPLAGPGTRRSARGEGPSEGAAPWARDRRARRGAGFRRWGRGTVRRKPMPLFDAHLHLFSRRFYETLAAQSPLPGTADERLATLAKALAIDIPSP